jgi:hypothetical protein
MAYTFNPFTGDFDFYKSEQELNPALISDTFPRGFRKHLFHPTARAVSLGLSSLTRLSIGVAGGAAKETLHVNRMGAFGPGAGTTLARIGAVVTANNFHIRSNSNAANVADDSTLSAWVIRFGSAFDDFAVFRAPPALNQSFTQFFQVNNSGQVVSFGGSRFGITRTVSTNQNLPGLNQYMIVVDTSAASVTVGLPTAASAGAGCTFVFVKKAAANTMTIAAQSGDSITYSGNTSVSTNTQNGIIMLTSDGVNVWVEVKLS